MKVLYLFNGYRKDRLKETLEGRSSHANFWGMTRLGAHGVHAEHLELESVLAPGLSRFLREHLSIYFMHVPLFFRLLSYDIIYTSSAFGTQLLWTLWPFRKPLWVMQDFSIMGLLGRERTLKQKLFRFLVERCSGIVAVGIQEVELLKKRFPHLRERIRYIPFGTDIAFFAPKDVLEAGYVIAVGFDPDRDWKTLIEATRGLGVRVIIATKHKRIAHLMPLPSHIEMKTFTPLELVEAYVRASLIVVPLDPSSGINDAMGCSTVFEAMAMGKALVATRTHTLESYVDGENGILVPERDSIALRAAIEPLLNDPARRKAMGERARKYALEHLDDQKLAGKLAVFFTELAQK